MRTGWMLVLIALLVESFLFAGVNGHVVAAAAAQKVGVIVRAEEGGASQIPGGYVWLRVGLYHTDAADKNGLSAADITISYDETEFEAQNNLVIYDEAAGHEVWRQHTFMQNYEWQNPKANNPYGVEFFSDISVSAPVSLDLDPSDGRKEIRLTVKATGKSFLKNKTDAPDDLLSLRLGVKMYAPMKKSAITVRTDKTVLTDSKGSIVSGFYYKAAHLTVGMPQSVTIANGSRVLPAAPLTLHVGDGFLLGGVATYASGDYFSTFGSWSTSDKHVITVSKYGDLDAVGIGTAKITFISDELGETGVTLKTEKVVHVVADSVAIPPEPMEVYPSAAQTPVQDDVQMLVNGEDAGFARLVGGSLYAPLKAVGHVLDADVSYSAAKKIANRKRQSGQLSSRRRRHLSKAFGPAHAFWRQVGVQRQTKTADHYPAHLVRRENHYNKEAAS
ncbi:hypothetical protein [Cohnella sp. AR92]|uniref:hypothetical protein n=1 Tax=Cohnella sp. AR92 TaxID=648716 RepID=UPI000F8E4C51|nr:hypothetical protein [Cohnella sp. AR92]RUS44958.1 hypothetical protein ELR57_22135 [Cohnella sp. AR92]